MKRIITKDKNGLVTKILLVDDQVSQTQQHHKDAHDINNIMKKYQKIGVNYNRLPATSRGQYGDFSNTKTYQQTVQSVIDANQNFAMLPSSIRKRFHNDPQELFDFLNDKQNKDEAIKLGLIDAPPPLPPTPEPNKN